MSRAACTGGTGMECCAGRRAHPPLGYFAAGCVSVRSGRARGTGARSRAIKTRAILGMRHSAALVVFGRAQGDTSPLNKLRCRPQSPKVTQRWRFYRCIAIRLSPGVLSPRAGRGRLGGPSPKAESVGRARPAHLHCLKWARPGSPAATSPTRPWATSVTWGSNARASMVAGRAHLSVRAILRSSSARPPLARAAARQ